MLDWQTKIREAQIAYLAALKREVATLEIVIQSYGGLGLTNDETIIDDYTKKHKKSLSKYQKWEALTE
jgi:hypothetical protein